MPRQTFPHHHTCHTVHHLTVPIPPFLSAPAYPSICYALPTPHPPIPIVPIHACPTKPYLSFQRHIKTCLTCHTRSHLPFPDKQHHSLPFRNCTTGPGHTGPHLYPTKPASPAIPNCTPPLLSPTHHNLPNRPCPDNPNLDLLRLTCHSVPLPSYPHLTPPFHDCHTTTFPTYSHRTCCPHLAASLLTVPSMTPPDRP